MSRKHLGPFGFKLVVSKARGAGEAHGLARPSRADSGSTESQGHAGSARPAPTLLMASQNPGGSRVATIVSEPSKAAVGLTERARSAFRESVAWQQRSPGTSPGIQPAALPA